MATDGSAGQNTSSGEGQCITIGEFLQMIAEIHKGVLLLMPIVNVAIKLVELDQHLTKFQDELSQRGTGIK